MPNFDFEQLKAERRRDLFIGSKNEDQASAGQGRPASPFGEDQEAQQGQEGGGFLSALGDVALAPVRGLEGAAQDLYGLGDTLVGGALPDYNKRLFGESKTAVGGIVESVVNFGAGFLPVVGWLGKAGRVGRTINLTTKAEQALRAAGQVGKARALAGTRAAVAGAAADFAVFDGHEARLSNILNEYPALANPITEFLAADDSDPELFGRAKAAVEGIGLGLFTDAVLLGVKALKAGRAARAAGAGPEEVQAAMDAAVPPKQLDDALERAARGEAVDPSEVFSAVEKEIQLTEEFESGKRSMRELEGQGDPLAEMELLGNEGLGLRIGDIEVPAVGDVRRVPKQESLLRHLGLEDEDIGKIKAQLDDRMARMEDASGVPNDASTAALNPRKLSKSEKLELALTKAKLNLSRFKGPERAMELIRTYEDLFKETMEEGVENLQAQTFEQLDDASWKALRDIVHAGGDGQSLMRTVQRRVGALNASLPRINAEIRAMKSLMLGYGDALAGKLDEALKPQIAGQPANAALLEVKEMAETYADLVAGVKGLLAEQGRGLGANRIETRQMVSTADLLDDAQETIAREIQNAGGADALVKLAGQLKLALSKGGTEGAAAATKIAMASSSRRFFNVVNEYWINAILSGSKTMVVNGLGGVMTSIYRPLESMFGAGLQHALAGARGDRAASKAYAEVFADAAHELTGLITAAPEALRMAAIAIKSNENLLDPFARVGDVPARDTRAIQARTFNVDADSTTGRAIDFTGRIVRLPAHILSGTDEFIKQMNYRASARSKLMREAVRKGIPPDSVPGYVADQMDKLIYQGQAYSSQQLYKRGLDEATKKGIKSPPKIRDFAREYVKKNHDPTLSALSKFALDHAEEVTFTRALTPGTISATVQNAVNAHPFLRLVMPFVRTPINIAKFTGQRVDAIGAVQALHAITFGDAAKVLESSKRRLVLDALGNDPRRKADALGRISAGVSMAAWGFHLATNGQITGRGPKDPEQRKILEQAGWMPYSFKTDTGYISYARIDPFATLLGTFADIGEYARNASAEDQSTAESLANAVVVAFANNFTNKSYLTGLGNIVEALEDPGAKVPKILQRYAASFVPSAVSQLTLPAGDESTREVRSLLDAAMSRVPGLSDNLPPMRNVLGEPINRVRALGADTVGYFADFLMPVAYRSVNDTEVAKELGTLGHGFTPPKAIQNGIDLSAMRSPSGQTAYDRWGELHGEVKIGGKTLKAALRKTIRSAEYQKLSPVSTPEFDSPRIPIVSGIVQDYRRAAWRQLLREFPELAALDRQFYRTKRQLALGKDPRQLTE